MAASDLTAQRLRELLDYNAETGAFTNRVRRGGRAMPGPVIGTPKKSGHLRICIDRRYYLLHRLAWIYVHGDWPKQDIDHINGDPSDNRIANLRDVTPQVNAQNQRKANPTSTTGIMGAGVSRGRFRARIRVGGQRLSLGFFGTADEAAAAYLDAKRELHPGCAI